MQYRIRNGDKLSNTIGSRNLYTGTANFSGDWFNKYNFWVRESDWVDPNGNDVYTHINHASFAWFGLGQTVPVAVGTYTFSCYAWFELTNDQSVTFYMGDSGYSGTCQCQTIGKAQFDRNDAKKWIHVCFTVNVTTAGNIAIRPELNQDGGQVYVGSYCLQKGITDGQWSPNPADYSITDRNNAYRVTGLAPSTTYQLSVAAFNGLRESPKESITVHTRGLRVSVPTQLPMNATYSLSYEEYALGLVPIGTEPAGMFGGGNRQTVPAKVISSGSTSVLEITSSFNLMSDNMTMKQLPDGSFAAYQGYKALFFNK